MDFLTVLKNVLAVVETGALLMALVFLSRGLKEKKAQRKSKKKQNVPVDKSSYVKAGIFGFLYIVLNVIRIYGILG